MKGILKVEMGRALHSRRYWVVLFLALAIICVGWYRVNPLPMLYHIHPVNLLTIMLGNPSLTPLAALMATLPYADSLLDDQNSGFLRAINMRTSYRSYLKAKSLAVVLSGGISVIGLLLLTFVFSLFINQSDLSNLSYASLSALEQTAPWGPFGGLFAVHPFYYLAALLLTFFIFGAIYALMGLAVSTLVNNRYVVLAAPLVYYQLLTFLETRMLHLPPLWNPSYTLLPFEAYEGFTIPQMGIQLAVLLVGSIVCLLVFARRSNVVQ